MPSPVLWLCLFQGLDAESLEDRQRAVHELIERGDEAAARAALTSSDPEVRARAEVALDAIRWNVLERALPAALAAEEVPIEDLHRLTFDELRSGRVYRGGDHLVVLHADGVLHFASPRSHTGQDFAVEALRSIRARTSTERKELVRAALRLMTELDKTLPEDELVWEESEERVCCGNWRARFTREGRLESLLLSWSGKMD